MKRIFPVLLFCIISALCVVSCSVRTPKGIMSESKMEKFLYDYHQAQCMAEGGDSAGQRVKEYTDAVLAKYDLSRNDFEENMKWYARNADKLYKIYGRISQRLDNEAQIFGESTNRMAADRYANMANTGDTANIWHGAANALLLPKPGRNLFSFSLAGDSICRARDKFEWHFKSHFVYQTGRRNAVAVMAVRYDNDSLTTVYQEVFGDMENTLTLQAVNLPIKQVDGFIYLEEPVTESAKLMFISKIALVRFHNLEKPDTATVAVPDSTAVSAEEQKQKFIDSIQGTANGEKQGDHFRTITRERAKPHERRILR